MFHTRNLQLKSVVIGGLTIGLLLILVSFFQQLTFFDNTQSIIRGKKIELVDGDVLEQRFVAQYDGLNKIGILFGNRKLQEYSYLNFILADKNCQNSIFEKTLKGEYRFDSRYLYNFIFPKIDNSKGRQYCLRVELGMKKKWSLWRKVKGKFEANKKSKIQKIKLFERSDVRNGAGGYTLLDRAHKVKNKGETGIVFACSYKDKSIIKNFQQLVQRISQYKPWFLKGYYLITVAIVFIFVTGWAVVELIRLD